MNAKDLWLGYWRMRSLYHRYKVDGFENLVQNKPCLLVGYHGSPIAYDLCMLTVKIYDEFGYLPHGFVNRSLKKVPIVWDKFFKELGFATKEDKNIRDYIKNNEHFLTAPGGPHEAVRPYRLKYKVDWENHIGYLKFAIKHNLPIIPIGSSGVDDVFIALNNGFFLEKKIKLPLELPVWFAFGALGIWPFAVPFPSKIYQIIGKPIMPKKILSLKSKESWKKPHNYVQQRVQRLVNRALNRG